MKTLALSLMLAALSLSGNSFAKEGDIHLTKVLSIEQVSSTETGRTFEVAYVLHCKDKLNGVFVTMLPQPFITEHTHHVVGVMVTDTGRLCAAADVIAKGTIEVPYGDVVDRTPLLVQPGE